MRSDRTTLTQRIEEVLLIRLDGAQFHDVVRFGSEKGWNVGERMIRKYIRRADELLAERLDHRRRRVIARHIAQRETLYARAVNAADYRTALAILMDLDRLLGLYPDQQFRDLARLAAAQGERIAELERRLDP
ncbi:MAG TPA: hypothetical protein VKE74_13070 [Gemmataceae bacterium]|nr:hypothetical protein [Gemmataceae bacterium]